jgi:hypothetical protein
MKKITKNYLKNLLLILVTFSLLIVSCTDDTTPTVYQDLPNGETPVISSVSPPDSVIAGVTDVTIVGQNFSPVPEDNIIYFNEYIAEILQSSETQLIVKTPNFVSDSVEIKISVKGAPLFSDSYMIDLKPAVIEIYNFQDFEVPYALTTDENNQIYFNIVLNGVSTGMNTISGGEIVQYSPKGGESFYTDIKYAGNGIIYGTRNPPVRAFFASEAGASPRAIAMADQSAKLQSLDIDNNGNIWVGGSGGNIYRVTPDEVDKKSFPFEPTIQSLRYFDGYLYAAAKVDSVQYIYRFEIISSDSLGDSEEYYNISANLPDYEVNTITFSEDGKLFMGTNAEGVDPNAIVYLSTDNNIIQWYPNVIAGPVMTFAWDKGTFLYYVRERVVDLQQQKIIKINMAMAGAPYYGRD